MRLRECLTFPLVLPVAGMESRIFADQLGLSRWPEHIVSAQTNSFGMLVELIKAGVGIGFMADFDAALEVERGTLVFLPLLDPGVPTPHLCVITKAGRTLPFATALILQRLGMHLERLVEPLDDREPVACSFLQQSVRNISLFRISATRHTCDCSFWIQDHDHS